MKRKFPVPRLLEVPREFSESGSDEGHGWPQSKIALHDVFTIVRNQHSRARLVISCPKIFAKSKDSARREYILQVAGTPEEDYELRRERPARSE